MSSEQQDEVQRFLDEQVRIRQQLRAVRRELDQDINNLGTTLKVVNILVMPVLLIGLSLLVACGAPPQGGAMSQRGSDRAPRRARRARRARVLRAARPIDRADRRGRSCRAPAALNDVDASRSRRPAARRSPRSNSPPNSWIVAGRRPATRADVTKLRQNLRALAEAKILETKTANPAFYDKLGVRTSAARSERPSPSRSSRRGKELGLLTWCFQDAEGHESSATRGRAGEAQSYLIDRDPEFPEDSGPMARPA